MQVRIPQLNCRVFKSAFLLVFFFLMIWIFGVDMSEQALYCN